MSASQDPQDAIDEVITYDLSRTFGKHLFSNTLFHDEHIGFSDEQIKALRARDPNAANNLEKIRRAVIDRMGFKYVRPIQLVTLPFFLQIQSGLYNQPHNILAQAQGGAGKTVAFVFGMLVNIDVSKQYTQALCLGLTRELSFQIMRY